MKSNPLRAWRETKHKRALDVAIKLGVSEQSVLQYERGSFRPSSENFQKIAELMGEDLAKLRLSWAFWEKSQRA
jgi:transcriptional regulator with XRE-family HTH domain